MEAKWSLRLIRLAAIFGLIGAGLGSHMAGSGSYQFRPIHVHILLVGWLSVFSWGMFYRVYKVKSAKLVAAHGWTAIIGSIGLTMGMWLNALKPFNVNETFALVFYIVGGTILLVSFGLFIITTFMIDTKDRK
ncbi:hypothetical protein ACQKMK_00030 [Viridibacillus arvi]|uniref:hypothetical protein n=1 Tax=Viridibacillus arvi TaxID=263475 RepID=UPI003CFC5E3C